MRVMITGGAGFLGTLVAAHLLEHGIAAPGGARKPVDELLFLDLAPPHESVSSDGRTRAIVGDLVDVLPGIRPVDVIFHLAGVVSGAAEEDFDLGMRVNLDGSRALLEWARASLTEPVLVFTSSLAVFGVDEGGSAPVIRDDSLPRPASSYGIQKFIVEQLVADYTRRGFVDGRSVRLMTVSVRPGKPNAAASSFLSGIIREPLAGQRADCPVPPDMPVAVSSPGHTLKGILRAAEASRAQWGSPVAVTLPALTTTPRALVDALGRVAGPQFPSLVGWTSDPAITAIVGGWPSEFHLERATRLGLATAASPDEIVREYMDAVASRTSPAAG